MLLRDWLLCGICAAVGACDKVVSDDRDGDGVPRPEDCNDLDADFFPGAPDLVGDGQDQDCDGVDGVDADDDGVAGEASGGTDCDDADPEVIGPGFGDPVGDGVDQNCDGLDGDDVDGDGFASRSSGGDDCDDRDALDHPGAPEQCDGEDNDCDPTTGEDGTVTIRLRGTTFSDLPEALNVVEDGEQVVVCAGHYTFPAPFARQLDVEIYARDATSDDVVITSTVWLTAGNVVLRDVNLEGGEGVSLDGRLLGGAIAVEGGALTVERAQIVGSAVAMGGVAWVGPGASLHLDLSDARGGVAESGGAIAVEGGTMRARAVSFVDSAADEGVVLYARAAEGVPAHVTWDVVQVGPAGEDAEAWAVGGTVVDVEDTTFSWDGGGLAPLVALTTPIVARGELGDGVSLSLLDVARLDVGAGPVLVDAVGALSLATITVDDTRGDGPLVRHHGGGALLVDDLGVTFAESTAGPAVLHASGDATVRDLHVGSAVSTDDVGVLLADGPGADVVLSGLVLSASRGGGAVVRVTDAASVDVAGFTGIRLESGGTIFDVLADDVVLDVVDLSQCEANDALVSVRPRVGASEVALSGAGVTLSTSSLTTRGALAVDGALGQLDDLLVFDITGGTGAALWLRGSRLTLDDANLHDNTGGGPGVVWIVPYGDTSLTMRGGQVVRNVAEVGGAFAFDVPGLGAPPGFDALDLSRVDVGEGDRDNAPADLYVTEPEGSRHDLGASTSLTCGASAGECVDP